MFGQTQAANIFQLDQNRPNPWDNETVISFILPEAGDATITIHDMQGRTIHLVKGEYAAGYNEVRVKRSDVQGATGLLYYTLQSGKSVATRKMVVVE